MAAIDVDWIIGYIKRELVDFSGCTSMRDIEAHLREAVFVKWMLKDWHKETKGLTPQQREVLNTLMQEVVDAAELWTAKHYILGQPIPPKSAQKGIES